jgi:hypothetical protein
MRLAFFHFRLPVSGFRLPTSSIEPSAFGQKGPDAEAPEAGRRFCRLLLRIHLTALFSFCWAG